MAVATHLLLKLSIKTTETVKITIQENQGRSRGFPVFNSASYHQDIRWSGGIFPNILILVLEVSHCIPATSCL